MRCFFHFLPLPAVSWPKAIRGLRTSDFQYLEWRAVIVNSTCIFQSLTVLFDIPESHCFICFNTIYTLSLEGQNAYLWVWCRFSQYHIITVFFTHLLTLPTTQKALLTFPFMTILPVSMSSYTVGNMFFF